MQAPKDRIHFILSHTRFASNLGAAARVIKNMGFGHLVLIRPQCEVGMEARAMAMKGSSILDRAKLYPTLAEAAEHLDLVVGSSGRFDLENPKWTSSRDFSREIVPKYLPGRIGVAFGAEDSGLLHDEIKACQWLIEIPTDPGYPVLNLAQAVGIIAYDLHLALSQAKPSRPVLNLAENEEIERLMRRIESALGRSPNVSTNRLMDRIGKIAGRAHLEKEDVQMLLGLLGRLG